MASKHHHQHSKQYASEASRPPHSTPTTTVQDRVVDVTQFAHARLHELSILRSTILQHKKAGHIRTYQLLPWHLRRRTMSFSSRRMPVRRKLKARFELKNMQLDTEKHGSRPAGKFRCRKYRRRAGWMLRIKGTSRGRKAKWLETHIWHAKRMHMVQPFGLTKRIAWAPVDRAERSTMRAASTGSLLHDASYLDVIEMEQISATQEASPTRVANILHILTEIVEEHERFKLKTLPVQQGKRMVRQVVMMHRRMDTDNVPRRPIAPVDVLFHPNRSKAWIWVHPAATTELLGELGRQCNLVDTGVSAKRLDGQLLRFSLIGPQSHRVLSQVLRPCRLISTEDILKRYDIAIPSHDLAMKAGIQCSESLDQNAKVWESFRGLRSVASLPSSLAFTLCVRDPREWFPPKSTPQANSSCKQSKTTLLHSLVNPFAAVELQSSTEVSLWDSSSRSGMSACGSFASRLARIKDLTKDNDIAASGKVLTCASRSELNSGFSVQVIVAARDSGLSRGFGSGWDIILPSRWAMAFWLSLIYAGCRAIGLRDMRLLDREMGIAHFPEDFPDTRAGRAEIRRMKEERELKHYRTPRAKRINYAKLRVRAPFAPDFDMLVDDIISPSSRDSKRLHAVATSLSSAESLERKLFYRVIRDPKQIWDIFGISRPTSDKRTVISKPPISSILGAKRPLEDLEEIPSTMEKQESRCLEMVRAQVVPVLKGVPKDGCIVYASRVEDFRDFCLHGQMMQGVEEPEGKCMSGQARKKQLAKERDQSRKAKAKSKARSKPPTVATRNQEGKGDVEKTIAVEAKLSKKKLVDTAQKRAVIQMDDTVVRLTTSRDIIGFVTSGDYSRIRGHGFGSAIVSTLALANVRKMQEHVLSSHEFISAVGHDSRIKTAVSSLSKNGILVLIRNVSSRCYRPAFLRMPPH